jgi:hypothetical protein
LCVKCDIAFLQNRLLLLGQSQLLTQNISTYFNDLTANFVGKEILRKHLVWR